MANPPQFAILNHAAVDSGIPRESATPRIGITPQQLGLPSQYWDGIYFSNNGASAIVLQQGNAIVVSFRGTDSQEDFAYYPELLSGTYINRFEPLLATIAALAPGGTHFYFTGHSLGGGTVNEMADIA